MAKNKDRSAEESLKGKLRKLEAENRHLKREVSRCKKKEHLVEDIDEKLEDLLVEEEHESRVAEQTSACSECGSFSVDVVDIVKRVIITCQKCKHREVIKR